MDRNPTWRVVPPAVAGAMVVMALALSLAVDSTPVSAGAIFAAPLCGNGSAPDYGFTYDLRQAHWTVDWEGYASEEAVTKVDAVLDRLNEDSIAQTMILILPQNRVGIRVNCAVHFLRYMKLGLPSGERRDNGFVFLIVVEPDGIDVHYGVGLGLPALTASDLTALNRAAEDAYQSTRSMDQALLALVRGFDAVARRKYAPVFFPTPTLEEINLAPLYSGPLGMLPLCGLLCLGILLIPFLLWALGQMARSGVDFGSFGSDSRGSGFPLDGGGGGSGPSWRGGSRGSGGGGGPSWRGGSGGGRSGRGN